MRKVLGLLALLASFACYAGCEKDMDCKGDRVCNAGQCVADDVPFAEQHDDASALTSAARLARIQELRRELFDLREELEDSGLYSPIVKLSIGGASGIVAVTLISLMASEIGCTGRNLLGCGDTGASALGAAVTGAVSVVMLIWGGIQLHQHRQAQETLPRQIQATEGELRALRADQQFGRR